jgi:hypothetical protein
MYNMSHVATMLWMKTSPHVSPHLMMWHVLVTDVADSCYMSAIEHPHHCLVCDCAKTFLTSHPSLVVYFFGQPNPTHKTESRTANMWEVLIVNHLDLGQSKTGFSKSDHIYYTLL